MERREFCRTSFAGLMASSLSPSELLAPAGKGPFLIAVKWGMIDVEGSVMDKFQLLKRLGFDGVEMDSPSDINLDEVEEAMAETGLPVSGLVNSAHWKKPFSHPDPVVRSEMRGAMEQSLREAHRLGSTTVLLVPAVVNADVSYEAAYHRCQEEIRQVLPLAEDLGVKIAIENVWNQFLLSPLEMARFIDEFDSKWIGVHFDIGNIVNYGWPEHWIRTLGDRIIKLDIKEFSLDKRNDEGLWKGFSVPLGEGSVNWPEVVKALRDIGYQGWATAEIAGGDEEYLQDVAARMNRLLERDTP